jgi:hypothetical protein
MRAVRSLTLFGLVSLAVPAVAATRGDLRDPPKVWPIQSNPTSPFPAPQKQQRELNTLEDIYTAIRRCYQPPALHNAVPGMRITVQFSYSRYGEIIGKPRILYETPGVSPEHQSAYRMAVAAALARCSPLPFSKSLGAAVAGRVFSMQFIDDRNMRKAEITPWLNPTTH